MDWITELNDQLIGAPAVALVVLGCIAIGYALRLARKFPNDAIPLTVIIAGSALFMLLAPDRTNGMQMRVWLTRNFLIGLILGFLAWRIHARGLKQLEDKIPFLKGILSTDAEAAPPPPPNPPQDQNEKT